MKFTPGVNSPLVKNHWTRKKDVVVVYDVVVVSMCVDDCSLLSTCHWFSDVKSMSTQRQYFSLCHLA